MPLFVPDFDEICYPDCCRLCGPVAQLGARFHGMEEVIGSNPIRSTKSLLNHQIVKEQLVQNNVSGRALKVPAVLPPPAEVRMARERTR